MRRKTHEEFIRDFYAKNKNAENIEILGKYVGSNIKIKCRCKKDGYEWEVKPNDLLNGRGCPKCSGNASKTTEEFKQEMKEINSDIEILGEYVNSRTKIKVRCKIDGYEWQATPNGLLSGYGCKKCAGKYKTTEDFKQELKEINNNIEVLGEYINNRTKIKVKCKKDGYEWKVKPNDLLNGHGCPKCSGNASKTTEEFKQELKEINNNIEVLGEYIGNKTKVKCKCKIDGYEWEAVPNSLLSGCGCPKCSESKGEKRIGKCLDNRNIEYERQYKFNDCRSKKELPFDFYIPSLNMAIEYDGEDHYMIFKRNKNESYEKAMNRFIGRKVRDTIKTIYCKENNIKLIRIPYTEYDNIEKILEKELED